MTPWPDEFVLGWRGRLRFLKHFPNIKLLVDYLRKTYVFRDDLKNTDCPLLFVIFSRAAGMPASEFLQEHTLLPFYRGLSYGRVLDNSWDKAPASFLKFYALSTAKDGAWYCPECVLEDLHVFGMPYWRRKHQLPAVDWCSTHKIHLRHIFGKKAFDVPPPVCDQRDKQAVDCCEYFYDRNPIIERYISTAEYILNRKAPVDFGLATHLLEQRVLDRNFSDGEGLDSLLVEKMEEALPCKWLKNFKNCKSSSLKITSAFQNPKLHRATQIYSLLFAFLYDSMDDIEMQFLRIDNMENIFSKIAGTYSYNFFLANFIFAEYIRCRGDTEKMKKQSPMNPLNVSSLTSEQGLPPILQDNVQEIAALRDFFSGKPIADACEKYGLPVSKLEQLLRLTGAKAHRAIDEIYFRDCSSLRKEYSKN